MLTKEKLLGSIKSVVEKSSFVSIDQDALDAYVASFTPTEIVHWSKVYPLGYKRRENPQDEIDFLFLIGNQAFCYWGYPKKWTIDYKGKKLDGWWANIAAFERALDKGIPLLEGEFLANMTLDQLAEVYAGEPEIPLLNERYQMLKSIGKTLVDKYQGRFHNFFEERKKDSFTLLESIVGEFAGFADVVSYKGKEVLFYKKAQLVLTDISKVEKINGIENFPGFADYKIPAVLRARGILKYSQELAEKVDNRIEIPAGSEMEVEIRANMLWVCNEIARRLKGRGVEISPVDFEHVLWIESQDETKLANKPYHLTRTIYY